MLGHLGMHEDHLLPRHAYLKNEIPVAGVAHQAGHLPLRHRPGRRRCSTPNCKAHELDNLYVVDTSFFPSIGAVNPALTAMANALRVGDHLLERLSTVGEPPQPYPSGAIPHAPDHEAPGSSRITSTPDANAFGGHVIGSIATACRRRETGSRVSPV